MRVRVGVRGGGFVLFKGVKRDFSNGIDLRGLPQGGHFRKTWGTWD